MKKIALFFVSILLLATIAKADLSVTEIMYNPNQADDTDAEWIEIFNNGLEVVDLSRWMLNGNHLESFLDPKQYLVIARELIDSDDADIDSFQSIWGSVKAIDGTFSLSNTEGSINLTNGGESDYVIYHNSMGANGNGYSLELFNGTWNESLKLGGTPSAKNSLDNSLANNEISLTLNVQNVLPEVNFEILTDDLEDVGIQIIANDTREIKLRAYVNDANGLEDIIKVSAEFNDKQINLTRINETFEGSFQINKELEKKIYEIKITAFDSLGNSSTKKEFEFIGVLATILETTNLNFNLVPGQISEEKTIAITNNGTKTVHVNLTAINTREIPEKNIEIFLDSWQPINKQGFILEPNERKELLIRIKVPNIKSNVFEGKIRVTSK
ncbi:MAG: lamin tail domain-containing protein [Nanoarchaeota archaeon]|nr:lamin tail domain-containing protein [Nanoarchaeota archaeon]MBU4352396.1 lamin tail domain-containing protein [Nanoarchaeota archaeon]